MSENGYEDFELELKYQDNTVSVKYLKEQIIADPVPYQVPSITTGSSPLDRLKRTGLKIAEMLLPLKIRPRFIEKWAYGKHKIRLRLCYPGEDDQLDALMKIPWEYIYLPEHESDPPKLTNRFLGLRDEISIVHSLKPDETDVQQRLTRVDRLRVNMKYFSWLGVPENLGDRNQDQHIFQNFVDEFDLLRNILDCHDLKNAIPIQTGSQNALAAESHQVLAALQDDDLIQITCHGDPSGISLPDGELLSQELHLETDAMRKIKAKAIILLSCHSANLGPIGHGLTRTLNEGGVPIVIGMTKGIHYEAARRFVGGFYHALAKWPSDGLERAIVHGRLAIFNIKEHILEEGEGSNWNASFGIPRLFLNRKLQDSVLIPPDLLYELPDNKVVAHFNSKIDAATEPRDDKLEGWQNQFDTWIKQEIPPRKWYLVTGSSGSGKSTQIAWLLRRIKEKEISVSSKIIYHFCLDELPETKEALAFVRASLVPQLIDCFGEKYKDRIPKGRFPLLVDDADQALRDFVIQPLRDLITEDGFDPPVIVIDGLSEVSEPLDSNNSILGLLLRHHDELQKIARFLVTADSNEADPFPKSGEDQNVAEALDNIQWNIYDLTFHEYGEADIIMGEPDDPSILFSQLASRFEAPESLQTSEKRSWSDVYELLNSFVEKAETEVIAEEYRYKWWKKKAHHLLDLVAIACEPLSIRDIAVITGLEPDNPEKKLLPSTLRRFFKGEEPLTDETPLIFYHPILKTYRLHEMNWWNQEKGEGLADIHELFVKAFAATSDGWAGITDWKTLSGTKWAELSEAKKGQNEIISRYARRYLVHHAYYSCYYTSWSKATLPQRRDRAKEFIKLICDPGFRMARFNEVGQQAALQDMWLGLRVINVEYIYALRGRTRKKTRVAFDRLLAADQPNSYQRIKLIWLEQQLRNGPNNFQTRRPKGGRGFQRNELEDQLESALSHTDSNASWKGLFEFLGLDPTWW